MVRIGAWNLENFFRPGGASGPTTQQAYDAKLVALAQTIAALDPDEPAVQEAGDPRARRPVDARRRCWPPPLGSRWRVAAAAGRRREVGEGSMFIKFLTVIGESGEMPGHASLSRRAASVLACHVASRRSASESEVRVLRDRSAGIVRRRRICEVFPVFWTPI